MMGFTYINLDQGKNSPHDVVAHLPGVRFALATKASEIGQIASGLLDARHGRTQKRFNDLPSPRITVTEGKLDWYVNLEAEGGPGRAIGIEFGHHYESRARNASGPWGASSGLHVLRDAATFAALFGG